MSSSPRAPQWNDPLLSLAEDIVRLVLFSGIHVQALVPLENLEMSEWTGVILLS